MHTIGGFYLKLSWTKKRYCFNIDCGEILNQMCLIKGFCMSEVPYCYGGKIFDIWLSRFLCHISHCYWFYTPRNYLSRLCAVICSFCYNLDLMLREDSWYTHFVKRSLVKEHSQVDASLNAVKYRQNKIVCKKRACFFMHFSLLGSIPIAEIF